MSDEPFYTPSLKRAPLSVGQPGEKLYEFCVEHDRYLFELRDHGELLGVEVQILSTGVQKRFGVKPRCQDRLADARRPGRSPAAAVYVRLAPMAV